MSVVKTNTGNPFQKIQINLWYYLDLIQNLSNIRVVLENLKIEKSEISGELVAVSEDVRVVLDSFHSSFGTASGRVIIQQRGLFLDIVSADYSRITAYDVPVDAVVVPFSFSGSVSVVVCSTDDVSVDPIVHQISVGVSLNISATPSEDATITTEPKGLKSVNGLTPSDGQVLIVGVGGVQIHTKEL